MWQNRIKIFCYLEGFFLRRNSDFDLIIEILKEHDVKHTHNFQDFSTNSYAIRKFVLNFLNTFHVSPNDISKFFML